MDEKEKSPINKIVAADPAVQIPWKLKIHPELIRWKHLLGCLTLIPSEVWDFFCFSIIISNSGSLALVTNKHQLPLKSQPNDRRYEDMILLQPYNLTKHKTCPNQNFQIYLFHFHSIVDDSSANKLIIPIYLS